ncbi:MULTISPECIES: glutathione synthetase [Streptomyces]|uniref:glutathione synthetase n=1 Tax=Streptomyces TaxID=1883 RepID=UPI0004BFE126|nr:MULTISPECIES: glutathione synthetase [Streptomyces]MDX3846966.1 glutathione synthetase [Streptomyces europaeiscabiei]
MALAAPLHAAAAPAYRTGTAAVIAPADAGDRYVPALARHGWNSVAVTEPAHHPDDNTGYFRHVTHRTSLRRTAAHLDRLGVQAVLAGSPAGTELADLLAARLHLPGNALDTADIRRDAGLTSAALLDAGITAPRSIRTARLSNALEWATYTQTAELVLQHPDPTHPHPSSVCRTEDDIRSAWHRLHHSSTQPLVLREHLAGTHYRIHTLTSPGPDGSTDHSITAIWSETRTADQQVCRADLLSRHGLLARALALYTMRTLTALGIRYGPAHATVTFIPDRGPALLSLRTDPYADFATDVLRQATGHDPIRDTALLLTTGNRPAARHRPHAHVTKIALLPRHDGALDHALLRTITALPTVAATTELTADTPVRADETTGWLLLVADDSRAINQDHQVIRAAENLGLYGRPVCTRPS